MLNLVAAANGARNGNAAHSKPCIELSFMYTTYKD